MRPRRPNWHAFVTASPRRGLRPLIAFFLLSLSAAAAGPAFGADRVHAAPARPPQTGIASWYGQEHAGRPTASGAAFDPAHLTAAHRKLPLGTRVRVTHVASGRSVVVTINDRGPYVRGRIIDLSHEAAEQLGMVDKGLAKVRLDLM